MERKLRAVWMSYVASNLDQCCFQTKDRDYCPTGEPRTMDTLLKLLSIRGATNHWILRCLMVRRGADSELPSFALLIPFIFLNCGSSKRHKGSVENSCVMCLLFAAGKGVRLSYSSMVIMLKGLSRN